jgi:hypothetical protein
MAVRRARQVGEILHGIGQVLVYGLEPPDMTGTYDCRPVTLQKTDTHGHKTAYRSSRVRSGVRSPRMKIFPSTVLPASSKPRTARCTCSIPGFIVVVFYNITSSTTEHPCGIAAQSSGLPIHSNINDKRFFSIFENMTGNAREFYRRADSDASHSSVASSSVC